MGLRRLLVLMALLAGLFAMHGLAAHGSGDAMSPMSPMSAMPAMAGHDDVGGDSGGDVSRAGSMIGAFAGTAAAVADEVGPNRSGAGHGRHGMGLMGMCLTLLVAAGAVLLALRRRLRGGVSLARLGRFVPRAPFLARSVGSAPPDLHALSILRC
ncbi:hypothetical protein BH11ACT8_BH11ACT8_27320 [soil metagenome]